jgi:hypothetical protein
MSAANCEKVFVFLVNFLRTFQECVSHICAALDSCEIVNCGELHHPTFIDACVLSHAGFQP